MVSFFILFPLLTISATVSSLPPHAGNAVVEVCNKLANDLHKKLSVADENVFFSPLSISTALAMLFYGARGKTADEMRRALGYQQAGLTNNQVHSAFQSIIKVFSEDSVPKEYLLYLANALLTQKGFPISDEYKTGLREIYQANARNVDFQKQAAKAVGEINAWIKQKTHNQITGALSDLKPDTIMVLLNVVYFKGTWKTKFDRTLDGMFFNKGLRTEKVKIPVMSYKNDVLYTRLEGAQAIELLYKGEDISMVIVLPDALGGLPKFEQYLTANTLKNIRRSTRKTRVHVILPKFKLEYTKTLNAALQDIGIKNVFEKRADLSGISQALELMVSKVIHKAVVDVNEEGTEASGFTGVIVRPMSLAINEIRFVVDRPFLFAIVDRRNDLVLFQGRINKL